MSATDSSEYRKLFTGVAFACRDNPSWMSTPGFPLSEDNISTLLVMSEDIALKPSTKLLVNSEPYIFRRRHDYNGIVLQKGASGLVTCLTLKHFLIGMHDEKTKAEIIITQLARVQDYLTRHGV